MMWGRLAFVAPAACSFQQGRVGVQAEAGVTDDGPLMPGAEAGPTDGMMPPMADARADGSVGPIVCPTGYNLSDNMRPDSKYRSVTASTTWAAAEADCEDDFTLGPTPAHLIVLDNDAERQWAFSINNSDQWIGLTDINTELTFIPVTNQTAFYVGAVSGNLPAKDCAILNATQTLAEGCTGGHPYLCECDGLGPNPNNF
jgi:hypothetical protein